MNYLVRTEGIVSVELELEMPIRSKDSFIAPLTELLNSMGKEELKRHSVTS